MISFLGFSFATCALAAQVLKRAPDNVPGYVVQYAPIVFIHSEDPYKPSDIATQLVNTKPEVDFEVVGDQPLTLDNLSSLNNLGGKDVYLTSNVKATQNPDYFLGVLPDSDGRTDGAVSCAIIVNDHGDSTVDAFYFYFYAFDHGALNIGNHVGDWEHSMIRFDNGTPSALWYSQHSNGQAFEYGTVDKYNGGDRVSYMRIGSEAKSLTTIPHSPSCTAPTALTQITQRKGHTPTASRTSTCLKGPSKTTQSKDRCGIPFSRPIGTVTVMLRKLSQLITQSQFHPTLFPFTYLHF